MAIVYNKIQEMNLPILLFILGLAGFMDGVKSGVDSKISVNKKGFFVDKWGRARIFHGFNSVKKKFPWYQSDMLNKTRQKLYQEWGFNVVRLGSMWTGAEPEKGKFNKTYLDILEKIIDGLASNGLYTFLDMHQDVIAKKFTGYDGVPAWITNTFPNSSFPYPFPFKKAPTGAAWGLQYLTVEVGETFQHLYNNTSGSLDCWGEFWKKMASTYGKKDSVLAYELMNEPWAGDIYADPKLIIPGEAGKLNLMPAYNKLAKMISQVDKRTIIFYEPVTWGVYSSGSGPSGSGFNQVPGGPSNRWRSALSYHYYCWILTESGSVPYPIWKRILCDEILLKQLFHSVTEDTKMIGGGSFLTEFGTCAPDKSNISINTIECEEVMKQADDNMQSWTYWDTQFFNDDGSAQCERLKAFSRAYPHATAGTPKLISFDVNTAEFNFEFCPNTTIKKPTEVYLPMSIHYHKGVKIRVTPKLPYKLIGNMLIINQPKQKMLKKIKKVAVKVMKK